MKLNFQNKQKWLYIFSFLLSIFSVLLMFSNLDEVNRYEFFNSDCLFFPNMFKDLILDGGSLKGWSMGTTPNLFPTALIYFIIAFLTQNIIIAHFINGLLSYSLVLFLLFLISKELSKKSYITGTYINLIFIIFSLHTIIFNDFVFSSHLFLPYHIGAFNITLLNLYFTIKYLKSSKNFYLILIWVLTTLTVFSNQIYLITSISFILSIFLLNIKIYEKTKLFLITISSTLLGLYFLHLLKNSHYFTHEYSIKMEFSKIIPSTKLLLRDFYYILISFDLRSLILLISIITWFILLMQSFSNLKNEPNKRFDNLKSLFIYFTLLYSFGSFFSSGLTTMYIDFSNIRYYISISYLLLGALVIFLMNRKISLKVNYLVISILIIVNFFYLFKYSNFGNLISGIDKTVHYYPNTVKALDSICEARNLTYGLAGYWDSHHYRVLSKNNLRIYTINEYFYPCFHNSSSQWYLMNNKTHFSNPSFNFILSGIGLSDDSIKRFLKSDYEIINLGNKNLYIFEPFTFNDDYSICSKKDTILNLVCDMEMLTEDKICLKTNIEGFMFYSLPLTNKRSFSGANAIVLSEDIHYCLDYKVEKVESNFSYEVSVLVNKDAKDTWIIACIKSPEDFYLANQKEEIINNDWKKLILTFDVPNHLKNEVMSINIFKPNNSKVYLDDYSIITTQNKYQLR